jgi:hypothetical protein
MFDLLVQTPHGGWATDTTGPLPAVRRREWWLRVSTRGRRQIVRIIDRSTGKVLPREAT